MKTRTITIPKKDILFDVDAATHVFAKVTASASLQRADNIESDTDDESSRSMVVRFADWRYAELKRLLARFMAPQETEGESEGESEEESDTTTAGLSDGDYTFTLYVEDAFQDELLDAVAGEMESYMAEGAIADWYGAAGDAQSPIYAAKLPPILNRIIGLIVSRKMPKRV